jgi:branched-chain amino acid aminotransferase
MIDISKSTAYFRDGFVPFDEAKLSIASAPVLYGLSVYTVLPVFWNETEEQLYVFRLEDHFRRLRNSAKIMAFEDFLSDWDLAKFEQMIHDLIKRNKPGRDSLVRVNIFVDDILSGTRMLGLKHSLSAFIYPMMPLLPDTGAKLSVSSWRRTPDNAIPSRAKINGSYTNAALMKHEAVLNGFDDAIALDEQGHVTESTVANIFLVRNGELISPGDSADLLEGITRDTVFGLARHFKIPQERRSIDRSELYVADEIFLCGSSVNITPVIAVDHRVIGSGQPGQLTARLSTAYQSCARHEMELFNNWTTPA